MNDRMIATVRSRIDRCRRLAAETMDDRTSKILRDMANEGEADLARMLAEQEAEPAPGERLDRSGGELRQRQHDRRH